MAAIFIAIEGPDKVGKETQTKLLQERLPGRVKRVEVPIHDFVTYRMIYWMLRNGLAKKLPATFQFVQFLNKLMWQLLVKPFLSLRYDYVVLDRWSLSSVIYGTAEDLSWNYVMFLYDMLYKPHITIVLHGTSFGRTNIQDDSYERDNDLQRKVRDGYRRWAMYDQRSHLVKNNGTPIEVNDRIMKLALKEHGEYGY